MTGPGNSFGVVTFSKSSDRQAVRLSILTDNLPSPREDNPWALSVGFTSHT